MMYRDAELGRILGAKRPDMTALGQVLDEMSHAQRVLSLERFSPSGGQCIVSAPVLV